MDPKAQVTLLLLEAKNGNGQAIDQLIPIVYDELRRLAARYLRDERDAATLQPTALVHEAYMRLVSQDMPEWECRSHFYGVAAHLMRQILVDHARRHRSQKRGSRRPRRPDSGALRPQGRRVRYLHHQRGVPVLPGAEMRRDWDWGTKGLGD